MLHEPWHVQRIIHKLSVTRGSTLWEWLSQLTTHRRYEQCLRFGVALIGDCGTDLMEPTNRNCILLRV